MKYKLGDICTITKGETGIMKAIDGAYTMITLGEANKTHNEFQFDTKAAIIPLVSSTGHGHASMKRVKYQEGKFALGNILCAVIPKDEDFVLAKYLQIYLHWNREELLVSQMKGMANVSLSMGKIADVEVIVPNIEKQKEIVALEKTLTIKELEGEKLFSQQLTLIENLNQAILQEAVQGKLLAKASIETDFSIPPAKAGGNLAGGNSNDNLSEIQYHLPQALACGTENQTSIGFSQIETGQQLLQRIKAEKAKTGKKEKPLPPIKKEEIPFEIPENWVWCRLGEVIQISSGDGLTSFQMNTSGTIPVYGGNGINGYHDKFNIDKQTIVIGRVGYYCGCVHLTENKAWVTDNAFVVGYSENNIDKKFLIQLLKWANLGKQQYAGSQPVISGQRVYPMPIPLPPYPSSSE
ncbi:MAG: restriction endonuclease subunit S [Emticicia sp.]|nr:restriction endonuclease subunit S [Emticicia sp.]